MHICEYTRTNKPPRVILTDIKVEDYIFTLWESEIRLTGGSLLSAVFASKFLRGGIKEWHWSLSPHRLCSSTSYLRRQKWRDSNINIINTPSLRKWASPVSLLTQAQDLLTTHRTDCCHLQNKPLLPSAVWDLVSFWALGDASAQCFGVNSPANSKEPGRQRYNHNMKSGEGD